MLLNFFKNVFRLFPQPATLHWLFSIAVLIAIGIGIFEFRIMLHELEVAKSATEYFHGKTPSNTKSEATIIKNIVEPTVPISRAKGTQKAVWEKGDYKPMTPPKPKHPEPIAYDEMNPSQKKRYDFFFGDNGIKDLAMEEQEKYGIPASIKMAQASLESKDGESKLATENKNYFGEKCFSKKCRKGHCSNFSDDSHKDFFKKYPSRWASFRAHSKFLQKDRYKPLYKLNFYDYTGWAKTLKKCKYATDPKYPQKIIKIIEDYGLWRYDDDPKKFD